MSKVLEDRRDGGGRRPAARWILAAAVLVLGPVGLWVLGSGMAQVVPMSFRCDAVLRLPEGSDVAKQIRSESVTGLAMEGLKAAGEDTSGRPMARFTLRSGISAKPLAAPGLFRVSADGRNAEEAMKNLSAVVEAYLHEHAAEVRGTSALVYAAPPVSRRAELPIGIRITLGAAALALAGLAGAIPLLRWLEEAEGREMRALRSVEL